MKKVTTSLTLMLSIFMFLNLNAFEARSAVNFMGTETVAEDPPLEAMIRTDNIYTSYFRRVSLEQLKKHDEGGAIIKGIEGARSQMNSLQSLLRYVSQSDSKEVREYVYDQLLEAQLNKSTGFLGRAALNSLFNNHNEPDADLRIKVQNIRKKME